MLTRAKVGQPPTNGDVVDAGMLVTVRFVKDGETETFLLGAREVLLLDSSVDMSVYSPQSPLGSAILGKKAGDSASFAAPTGKTVAVEIIDAKPFTS